MRKMMILAAAAACLVAAPAVAQTTTFNANPATPFTYGSGNDYTPANATVLTDGNDELAVRFHVNMQPAAPSNSNVYTFALGTTNVNFDYSFVGALTGANVVLTNLLTGDTAFFNPVAIGDANGINAGLQNSQQLGFGFLNGTGPFAGCCGDLNFDANVNNTYRIDFTAGSNTLSSFAQFGTGVPAVPEPATWAMMLIGFGGVGFQMRRQRRKVGYLLQAA